MTFTNTIGFDFSYWQGVIDFLKTLAYGAKFVILRCGYALTKDIRFDEYMSNINDLLPVSAYHYYDPRNPAPTKEWILANRWSYQFALNVKRDGTISRFPQNDGRDVIVLNLATRPVSYPLSKLRLIRAGTVLPSPYSV